MRLPLPRPRQSGVAIVELAVLLVFLLLLSIGITEFGRALWYYSALQKASREGARYLALQSWAGTDPRAACKSLVSNDANSAGISPLVAAANVDISCDGGNCNWGGPTAPEYVTVTITGYQMRWLWTLGEPLPAPGGSSGLRVQTTMPYTNG